MLKPENSGQDVKAINHTREKKLHEISLNQSIRKAGMHASKFENVVCSVRLMPVSVTGKGRLKSVHWKIVDA